MKKKSQAAKAEEIYRKELKRQDRRDWKFFNQGKGRRWAFLDSRSSWFAPQTIAARDARQLRHDEMIEARRREKVAAFKEFLLSQDRNNIRLFTVLDLIIENGSAYRKESIECIRQMMLREKNKSANTQPNSCTIDIDVN